MVRACKQSQSQYSIIIMHSTILALVIFSIMSAGRLILAAEDPFLFIIGGYEKHQEIISLDKDRSLPECLKKVGRNPPDVTYAAAGRLEGGIPFMCGGHHYYQESDSCWKYDLVQDAWSQTGNMSKRGISMASVYSDEFGGLVLTGGWNPEQKERFDFVEVTKDGRSFETLTPMPAGVDKHCLAVIDADRVMVVGGHSSKFGYSSRAAFMYDKMATGKWTSLADMPTGRYSVGCGTVRDGNGVALQVVVAGGANKESLDTVEIYDVVKGTWKTGTPLPKPYQFPTGSGVPLGDSFVLVGATEHYPTTKIYSYDSVSGDWILLEAQLSRQLHAITSVFVSPSLFPDCQREKEETERNARDAEASTQENSGAVQAAHRPGIVIGMYSVVKMVL